MKTCPICDGVIKREERSVSYKYKEHTRDILQIGDYCSDCHEAF